MPPRFSKGLDRPTIQAGFLPDQARTSPCQAACPAGNPIEKINALMAKDKAAEAAVYLLARNPLAGITGRICPRPCEAACNRDRHDESLSIRDLERLTAEQPPAPFPRKMPPTGKRIAIVGSGPAGMTGACFLALLGHGVVIFEADPLLGGIPRTMVPNFKLPEDIVDRQVSRILDLGITAHTGTRVGNDIDFETIRNDFDACLIASGSVRSRKPDIPGADLAQPALTFLKRAKAGEKIEIGKHVVILGGGGVAFDCAFTLKRLGASEVSILCVEGEECMCADAEDIAQAHAEGIRVLNSKLACDIRQEAGKVTGIHYVEIEEFSFDANCTLNIVKRSEKRHFLAADQVIAAIGVLSDLSFLDQSAGFSVTARGTLLVDPDTLSTSAKGVFCAGDTALGPSSAATAIGSGRRAALSIHAYLMGEAFPNGSNIFISPDGKVLSETAEEEPPALSQHVVEYEELMHVDYFDKKQRVLPSGSVPQEAADLFTGSRFVYTKEQAMEEAGRCFHCGQCFSCGSCVEDCPGDVLLLGPDGPETIYPDECWHCGNCRISCPCGAIAYEFPLSMLV